MTLVRALYFGCPPTFHRFLSKNPKNFLAASLSFSSSFFSKPLSFLTEPPQSLRGSQFFSTHFRRISLFRFFFKPSSLSLLFFYSFFCVLRSTFLPVFRVLAINLGFLFFPPKLDFFGVYCLILLVSYLVLFVAFRFLISCLIGGRRKEEGF